MSAQPELPAPASRPLRLGFLGLGWIGRKRLDAAAELPEIPAVHEQTQLVYRAVVEQRLGTLSLHGSRHRQPGDDERQARITSEIHRVTHIEI